MGYGDALYPFHYVFKQGNLEFKFDVMYGDTVYYLKRNDAGIECQANGSRGVSILNNSFRRELHRGFLAAGKGEPTLSDYDNIMAIVAQGLTTLLTKGGETLKHLPEGKFYVEIVDDLKTWVAKYPGRVRNFNPD